MKKWILLLPLLLMLVTASAETTIKKLVIFGDGLTDNGYAFDGGFGRFSNGLVWTEYLAFKICRKCLENDAWAGARTDYKNYNGFDWSGILWQVKEYKVAPDTAQEETLYIIWAGVNDFLNGDGDPKASAHNIISAAQGLISKGAQHIVVITVPNFTIAPAFNNPKVDDYAKFHPLKDKVKKLVDAYNANLAQAIADKQKELSGNGKVKLQLADCANFFDDIVKKKIYDNSTDVWEGTYKYPVQTGYMWWDGLLPMTSVHKLISDHIDAELQRNGYVLID
jgi:phospholipase/lecithinase/hemolysin